MKFGVLVFPGSNCDHDTYNVIAEIAHQPVTFLWHDSEDLQDVDAILVPGGFAYGDYLRTGAIARFSPVMQSVQKFAAGGGLVLGICNGFQILTEAGLLPGALLRNAELAFSCREVHVRVEPDARPTPFTAGVPAGAIWRLPIAHGEGRYFAEPETLAALEANRQIVLRYCDAGGAVTAAANPNGSSQGIAGVCDAAGAVLGLMPHPERAGEPIIGNTDGLQLFHALIGTLGAGADLRGVAAGG